jgi:hypothetical protein
MYIKNSALMSFFQKNKKKEFRKYLLYYFFKKNYSYKIKINSYKKKYIN